MKNLIIHVTLWTMVLISGADIGLAGEPNVPNDVANALQTMLNRAQNEEPLTTITDSQLKTAEPQQVLGILEPYGKDKSIFARNISQWISWRLAHLHPTPEIRQKVVERLVRVLFDPNDESNRMRPGPYEWLLTFTENDFNDAAREMIRQALAKDRPSGRHIMVCGVANMQEELPRLKKLLIDELAYQADPNRHTEWYHTLGWRVRLTRARMGVQEDINKCVSLIEQEIDDDNICLLLDDLGYIRQPEAVESLKKFFLSDLKLPPTNPGAEGEPYYSYLAPILVDNLSNFPIKKERGFYTKEDIDFCRKWMSEQKEWKIIR